MLVVSFGTGYAETRKKTIEAAEENFAKTFVNYDVFRAFTSPTIIRILRKRDNIVVDDVKEAMETLKRDNYEKVIVQSLHVMNGFEYDDMVEVVLSYKDDFEEVKVGSALLTSKDDFEKTSKALSTQFEDLESDESVVFVGHGTDHKANDVYETLEKSFHSQGHENVFVGTVEGQPTFERILDNLRTNKINKVILMPMMIVAGDHAKNDIAGDDEDSWKSKLEKEGFDMEIYLHGIGENRDIRDIFISHTKESIKEECN